MAAVGVTPRAVRRTPSVSPVNGASPSRQPSGAAPQGITSPPSRHEAGHAPSRHCSHRSMPRNAPPGPAAPSPAHWWFHCSSSSSRLSTSPTPPMDPRSSCRRTPRASSHRASHRSPAAAQGCWLSVPWGARHTSPSRMRKTITTWTTEVRARGQVDAVLGGCPSLHPLVLELPWSRHGSAPTTPSLGVVGFRGWACAFRDAAFPK